MPVENRGGLGSTHDGSVIVVTNLISHNLGLLSNGDSSMSNDWLSTHHELRQTADCKNSCN